ncbi:transporter [Desertivirga arenae]|uniref:transporter n=1 Tax=Desertivirga arenae TaxID=2810309 RepID=UPI001A95AABA|nr:transporter [Pedobacter sp. SYSU D00823]
MKKTLILTLTILTLCTIRNKSLSQEKPDEMDTDRPNRTETPKTVKKGHFQYETDLLLRENKTTGSDKEKDWLYNQANLKLGLFKNTDVQLIAQTYGKESTTEINTGITQSREGFGDIILRVKQNIKGNKQGSFAVALVPYFKIPTSTFSDNQRYEGGLLLPMRVKLPGEWELSFQVEADRLKDSEGEGMHTEFLQSINLNHDIVRKLKAFAETYYTFNFKDHHWNNFLDAALQVEIKENFKIDGGFNYGIQKDAEKNVFLGAAFCF